MEPFAILEYFFITLFVLQAKGGTRKKRIVGGNDALPHAFPYQVCLRKKNGHKYQQYCGGLIINEQYILTAAHCITRKRKEDIQVVFGVTDLNSIDDEDPNFTRNVLDMYWHDSYDKPDKYANDIALIKVQPMVLDNVDIGSVDLPKLYDPVLNGTKVWISGWGRIYGPDSPLSSTLKATQVTIINHFHCVETYRNYRRPIYPTQFCALETHKNDTVRKGACNGDSGGPVTLLTSGKRVLMGIISWGLKDPDCASPKFPDVYTKVPDYINWINKQMDRLEKTKKPKKESKLLNSPENSGSFMGYRRK